MNNKKLFSFTQISDSKKITICNPEFISSTDRIKLAYYPIKAKKPISVLLFIHGGGAYSNGGYQYLANGLCEKYNVSVYLLDIRGHGNSEGPRGDSPSSKQVFQDLNLMIDLIKKENPNLPFYLGGHSSGGGLILNYYKWNKDLDINGYIFISPEFGYKSKTAREKIKNPFVKKVDIPLFILYRITQGRFFGNTPAVLFNYPEAIIKEQPLLIKSITCNMSVSLTPNNPQEQFSSINKPFGLFVGENDELFDPQRLISYAEIPQEEIRMKSVRQIVKNAKHLTILEVADELIGDTIIKINSNALT